MIKRCKLDELLPYITQHVYTEIKELMSYLNKLAISGLFEDNELMSLVVTVSSRELEGARIIEFVYTLPPYRRKGYATRLMKQLVGFKYIAYSNDESYNVFVKAGWTRIVGDEEEAVFGRSRKLVKEMRPT